MLAVKTTVATVHTYKYGTYLYILFADNDKDLEHSALQMCVNTHSLIKYVLYVLYYCPSALIS